MCVKFFVRSGLLCLLLYGTTALASSQQKVGQNTSSYQQSVLLLKRHLNRLGFAVGAENTEVDRNLLHAIARRREAVVIELPESLLRDELQQVAALPTPVSTVPGESFKDCLRCPEVMVVPAGERRIGWKGVETEEPEIALTIAEPLAVGRHEVSRDEFEAFVAASGYVTDAERGAGVDAGCQSFDDDWQYRAGLTWREPGFAQVGTHPVVCVSWVDAQAYVRWLSAHTGQAYGLLSETLWEYVASVSDGYFSGDFAMDSKYMRWHAKFYVEPAMRIPYEEDAEYFKKRTVAGGRYSYNSYGLYNLHGNVFEWAADCWHENYEGMPSDGKPRAEPPDCSTRVRRGGGWASPTTGVRTGLRYKTAASLRSQDTGFRVVRLN